MEICKVDWCNCQELLKRESIKGQLLKRFNSYGGYITLPYRLSNNLVFTFKILSCFSPKNKNMIYRFILPILLLYYQKKRWNSQQNKNYLIFISFFWDIWLWFIGLIELWDFLTVNAIIYYIIFHKSNSTDIKYYDIFTNTNFISFHWL